MAKEPCALCGKPVGGIMKMTLGDGTVICSECWSLGKFGIGAKPKQFTIDTFREHLETDLKSLAAQKTKERNEEYRQAKEDAAREKQAQKNWDAMEKLGLNFDRYDDADLRYQNTRDVQQMAATLLGSKFYSAGAFLSGNPSELFRTEMTRVQVYQNMMLIRQNEEIIRLLKRMQSNE